VPDLLDVPLFFVLSSVELVPVPVVLLDPEVVVPVAEPLPLVVPVCPPDGVLLLLLLSEQPQAPRPMVPDKMAAVSRYRSFLILPPFCINSHRCAPTLWTAMGMPPLHRDVNRIYNIDCLHSRLSMSANTSPLSGTPCNEEDNRTTCLPTDASLCSADAFQFVPK
jgi:hypothetical protein